jgi:hypothetical protein
LGVRKVFSIHRSYKTINKVLEELNISLCFNSGTIFLLRQKEYVAKLITP